MRNLSEFGNYPDRTIATVQSRHGDMVKRYNELDARFGESKFPMFCFFLLFNFFLVSYTY